MADAKADHKLYENTWFLHVSKDKLVNLACPVMLPPPGHDVGHHAGAPHLHHQLLLVIVGVPLGEALGFCQPIS